MGVKKFFKYIFSIDTTSSNRTIVYFLGIRIRHIKKSVIEQAEKYRELNCPITEIPKAEGILRKIQLANLKLLIMFDKICQDNDLKYWLDFGNLLGAIRHKGFIPWDDDVDVSMMRKDYETLIERFKNGIPQYPDLYLKFDNNGKNKCFIKILHRKISNVQIDIFPCDFYYKKTNEDEKKELTKLIKKVVNKRLYKIIFLLFRHRPDAMYKRFKRNRDKILLKNHTVDETIQPTIFYGLDYPHPHKRLALDYETIFPLQKIKYEDVELLAPNNCDQLLKYEFGNYMELPKDCYSRHVNTENNELEKLLDNFINEDKL